jgi:AcrR family transcriptional regulator/DNA-binding MarR family transcriptional regulator
MPAAGRGAAPAGGRVSPTKRGARRSALKARPGSAAITPRVQVAEMQRARLLAAAVATFAELGYSHASVAHITARARVSRRTFYDLFENREDCLLAVLRDASAQVSGEIAAVNLGDAAWRERVRGGLLAVLSFFDREPTLARVCVVQALQGGPRVLAWREETLARLAEILDQGRESGARSRECTALTAEGLVGAAFSIVYARLSTTRRREPLTGLVNELMSLIVLPYQGPAAARAEQRRVLPPTARAKRVARSGDRGVIVAQDPLRDVPMRLTYRTARVLEVVAEHPGASNRVVAEHADIADQGQVSKLLARLERLELMSNTGEGHARGERNAWRLTELGESVASRLGVSAGAHAEHEVLDGFSKSGALS